MGFDELNLLVIEAVLCIKLAVDVGHGLRPVDVGGGSEVLQGDILPFWCGIVLRNLQNSEHGPSELRFYVFEESRSFRFRVKTANANEGLRMPY